MKADLMLQKAAQTASKIAGACSGQVFKEEFIAAWGSELFNECWTEAAQIRKASWEWAKAEAEAKNDGTTLAEIDFEPPIELVLAVGLRKLFKISLYNRGDFPQNTRE